MSIDIMMQCFDISTYWVTFILSFCCWMAMQYNTRQGRRNTFKTRGAEDSRYTRGRFASGASEKNFEAN